MDDQILMYPPSFQELLLKKGIGWDQICMYVLQLSKMTVDSKGNVNGTIVYSQVIQVIWHTILEIMQLCNHNPHGPIQQNQEISMHNIKYKLSSFAPCRLIFCFNLLHHQSLWIKFFVGLISWFVIGLLLPPLKLIPTSLLLKQEPAFTHRTFDISWSENHLSFFTF